jgi:hypothetical protein
MTVKGDVVSNAFEGSSSNPGPVDEPLREEEF